MKLSRAISTGAFFVVTSSAAWAAPRVPEGGPGCAGLQTEQEPNDTAANASLVALSDFVGLFSGIYGTIASPGDVDWYRFTADANTRLFLSVDTGVADPSGSRDSVVSIFASDGVTLIEEDDDDGTGNGRDFSIESFDASLIGGLTLPVAGTYYARVRAKDPGQTIQGYSILIAFGSGTTPEMGPNDEFPVQQLTAQPILGSLSSAADVDWYAITLLDAGIPFLVLDGDPERDGTGTDATVFFESGPILTDSSGAGSGSDPPAEGFAAPITGNVRITGTGPGTYLIGGWYSGELCQVPVGLKTFLIE